MVALLVPALNVKISQTSEVNLYLFDYFGISGSFNASSSSVTSSVNYFYGILIAIIYPIAVILAIFGKNKLTKIISLTVFVVTFCFSIIILKATNELADVYKANNYETSVPGSILLLISEIIGIFPIVFSFIPEKIDNIKINKSKPNKAGKSKYDRLVELNELYEKKLITEEEYQNARKEILNND